MAEADWVFPPLSATPESLGVALHDAFLESFSEDRLTREMRLTFRLGFPNAGTDPKRVVFLLRHVTHFLLVVARRWPGPVPEKAHAATPEGEIARAAYWRKARIESVGIEVLIAWLMEEKDPVLVFTASLHRSDPDLTLVVSGDLRGERFGDSYELRIGAGELEVLHEDGNPLGLDTLVEIARSAWKRWTEAARSRS